MDSKGQQAAGGLFDESVAAALRAWHQGLPSRQCVEQYLPRRLEPGRTARGVLGQLRRDLAQYARIRHREDLAAVFECPAARRKSVAPRLQGALNELRALPLPEPLIGDAVDRWFPARIAKVLQAHKIRTLADLTVRTPRRRQWWVAIPGLGEASAREVERFFAANPELTERARALIARDEQVDIVPLERQKPAHELDGSQGRYRAPAQQCLLEATNDLEAVHAWLNLHEAEATRRAYRKEAERLILWAVFERGKPLSSLNTEDATAYRAFLRNPSPQGRWVGKPRPRTSSEWRPFTGPLSANSIRYSLSVLGALFRWLMDQRYVLANPFSGLKVRGSDATKALDAGRSFTEGEWTLIRQIADQLEWHPGWTDKAAQRMRFLLDFGQATGLRAAELVGLKLRAFQVDEQGDVWLHVTGKGAKKGRVAVPPLALQAVERYLMERGLPILRASWSPETPLLASLGEDGGAITGTRLRAITKKFFETAADIVEVPAVAEKLRLATPHWLRHTHATHALAAGAELTAVRDNLRHASISTTTTYLHGEDRKRAKQFASAFGRRD